jgi:hypothetical protein
MEEQKNSRLTHYDFIGTYGVDDIWAEDPWLSDYGNWPLFAGHFGITEEQYAADPLGYAARVRERNEQHIAELKVSGKFGQTYTVGLDMVHNPLFDKSTNQHPESRPMESYKMVFLDFGAEDI